MPRDTEEILAEHRERLKESQRKQERMEKAADAVEARKPRDYEQTLDRVETDLDFLGYIEDDDDGYRLGTAVHHMSDETVVDLLNPHGDIATYEDGEIRIDKQDLNDVAADLLQEKADKQDEWFDRVGAMVTLNPDRDRDGILATVYGKLDEIRGYGSVRTDEMDLEEMTKAYRQEQDLAEDSRYHQGRADKLQRELELDVPDHVVEEYGEWDIVVE